MGNVNNLLTNFSNINHNAVIGKEMLRDGVIQKVVLWVPGMVCNGFDCVIKISLLVVYGALAILITLAQTVFYPLSKLIDTNEDSYFKETKQVWLLVVDTILTVGSDLVGILVPYLGYKVDEYFIQHFSSDFLKVQSPYPIKYNFDETL